MTTRMPTITGYINNSGVTRTVSRSAILGVVKQKFPDAYISGNQIIIPTLPEDYQEGDSYALRIFTTPSYRG